MRNFNEIIRKHVTYDTTTSHRKLGLYPLPENYILGKTTWGCQIDPTTFLALKFYQFEIVTYYYVI